MTRLFRLLIAVAALLASLAAQAQQPARFPVISLTAGMHVVRAELAATEDQRRQGLMYREKMGQNEGMVFVFDAPAQVCMWMKNTLIPLSVAFLDQQGKILNIEDMQPQTTDSHCANAPARYALEMNQGWFAKRRIAPGMKIEGLPR